MIEDSGPSVLKAAQDQAAIVEKLRGATEEMDQGVERVDTIA